MCSELTPASILSPGSALGPQMEGPGIEPGSGVGQASTLSIALFLLFPIKPMFK